MFRSVLGVDDATWERARGVVLSGALFGLVTFNPDGTVEGVTYYAETNPIMVEKARRGTGRGHRRRRTGDRVLKGFDPAPAKAAYEQAP